MRAPLGAIVAIVAIASGCATTSHGFVGQVESTNQRSVDDCVYVGDVRGSSAAWFAPRYGSLNYSTNRNRAQREAVGQASRLSADHIVWTRESHFPYNTVEGRAYSCPAR